MLGFIVLSVAISGSLIWLYSGGIEYIKNHKDSNK